MLSAVQVGKSHATTQCSDAWLTGIHSKKEGAGYNIIIVVTIVIH
jgi:hypothetical protein